MDYLAPRCLRTSRLELRPFRVSDHPVYAGYCADPEVMRYIGTGQVNTPEGTWRSMSALLGHWELLGYGIWAVALRHGPLVGHCGFIDVPGWPGFELAYLFGREHWGRGYAQEAARAALDVAYGTLRRERVISLIRPQNARSVQMVERMGALREGEVDLLGAPAALFVHRRP